MRSAGVYEYMNRLAARWLILRIRLWMVILFAVVGVAPAHGEVALLLEEPYGELGSLNPTGHAAIYLTRVCADSPTLLRRCQKGEAGVVISRYHGIAGYDWLAIPLLPYLYAVESREEIPQSVSAKAEVVALRDSYRHRHLLEVAPDNPRGKPPSGDWVQLVGAAYDRTIFAFTIETTEQQDDDLIRELNARANKARYNAIFRNCADFSRTVLNFYHPGAVHRSLIADAGITTPSSWPSRWRNIAGGIAICSSRST